MHGIWTVALVAGDRRATVHAVHTQHGNVFTSTVHGIVCIWIRSKWSRWVEMRVSLDERSFIHTTIHLTNFDCVIIGTWWRSMLMDRTGWREQYRCSHLATNCRIRWTVCICWSRFFLFIKNKNRCQNSSLKNANNTNFTQQAMVGPQW